jgi:hypothetical protein
MVEWWSDQQLYRTNRVWCFEEKWINREKVIVYHSYIENVFCNFKKHIR